MRGMGKSEREVHSAEGRSGRVVSSSKRIEGGGERKRRERGCEDHLLGLLSWSEHASRCGLSDGTAAL